jgi:hypothetical protein
MAHYNQYFLGHSSVEQRRLQQQAGKLADESARIFDQIGLVEGSRGSRDSVWSSGHFWPGTENGENVSCGLYARVSTNDQQTLAMQKQRFASNASGAAFRAHGSPWANTRLKRTR